MDLNKSELLTLKLACEKAFDCRGLEHLDRALIVLMSDRINEELKRYDVKVGDLFMSRKSPEVWEVTHVNQNKNACLMYSVSNNHRSMFKLNKVLETMGRI